jgi:nucleoside-diphosphate-sugar epimerase
MARDAEAGRERPGGGRAGVTVAFVTGGSGFVGNRLIRGLRKRGDAVYGLARSDESAAKIERAGAEPVRGDLDDPEALRDAMRGADLVFHVAEMARGWGRPAEFERINVEGTRNVLWGMVHARVARIIHLSTAWVLSEGRPLVDVDETTPAPKVAWGWYHRTKLDAERAVLASTADGIEPVVVRPGLVWGPGDPRWRPGFVEAMETGRFRWVGGGRHLVSTTHVANLAHGLMLAGDRGKPGGIYFVTDGAPVEFRDFATRYLATVGLTPRDRSVSPGGARFTSTAGEGVWSLMNLKRPPALTRTSVAVMGAECTVRSDAARDDLGYEPVIDVDRGMEQLAERRNAAKQQES